MNCGGILYTTNAKEVHGNQSGICQLSDRCSCMFAQKLHVVIADRSYLYVLCVLSLVYCMCVYMSMWVIIADQSVYYTRLYMLVAVGDTWQMRWCWRHDSGGKIRYAVTGPQFILISMDGIETHLASNSDLKKKV